MVDNKLTKLRKNNKFKPCSIKDGDELYPNGIFVFNISKILEDIASKKLSVKLEAKKVSEIPNYGNKNLDLDFVPKADLTKPVIMAQISPRGYNLIDGHHRMEKARMDGVDSLQAYFISYKDLIPYFVDSKGYQAYVGYWNEKLTTLY